MDRTAWLTTFSAALGIDAPDDDDVEALLELAGVAAHASERAAAPVARWLAARAGVAPRDALRLAREVSPTDPRP